MKLKLIIATFFAGMLFLPAATLAQQVDILSGPCAKYKGETDTSKIPTACQQKNAVIGDPSTTDGDKNPLFGDDGILTKIVTILSILVGIGAVIGIMLGGLKFITSGSNPQEVSKAREIIIYAVVGLFVAALAQVIVRVFLTKI